MLKILQARLQHYVNRELPDVQAGFRKGRGTRNQIANIRWIMEKAREFQKNICFIDYTKAFDCVDHNKLWKILKEMGIPDHLTCLLRNLYTGQAATVRAGYGTTDWFQKGKGVCQGCILSPCLFNLYAEYIKGFGTVNKAEVDVFLELSCFFHDPADVDNLISVSSAFSKTSLNIWKFTVHIMLKPGLENFEHYFTSV